MAPVAENLRVSLGACQQETAGQLETASAYDAKLMGMLGFMAAVAGVMLTVSKGLASYRWILFVGASGSIVIVLIGLVGAKDLKTGPDPSEFYDDYGGVSPDDYAEQLFSDMTATISENKQRIAERTETMAIAFSWAAVAALAYGAARLLVAVL